MKKGRHNRWVATASLVAGTGLVLLFLHAIAAKEVRAGVLPIPGGFTITYESPTSPLSLFNTIKKVLTAQLRLQFIRRIQNEVLRSFGKIENQCPPWLKFRGTNVCRQIVDDWGEFFSDALFAAREKVRADVARSNLPGNEKAILQNSLGSLEDRTFDEIIADAGPPPSKENTWENFYEKLKPEKNILGQLLLLNDEQVKEEAKTLAAAKKQNEFLGKYECPDGEALDPKTGKAVCPSGWREVTPGTLVEETTKKAAVSDIDQVLNEDEFEAIAGALVNTLFEQTLTQGFFNVRPMRPAPVPSPAPIPMSFTANPGSIAQGDSSTLQWASYETGSCEASAGWSGTKPIAGEETVTPATTTIYVLTCGTQSVSATVTVSVPAQ